MPQVVPANTVTFCVVPPAVIVAVPAVTVHVYCVIPAGAEYTFEEDGQTLSGPVMLHVGNGLTVTVTH